MKPALFERLACPMDKTAPLKLMVFTIEDSNVIEGLIECPACNRYYPIVAGIPIMTPDEFRDPSFEAPFLEKWRFRLGDRYGKGKGFTLPPEIDKNGAS
ncbi:Trm112 family protein [candidate division KSB1 bacterium]